MSHLLHHAFYLPLLHMSYVVVLLISLEKNYYEILISHGKPRQSYLYYYGYTYCDLGNWHVFFHKPFIGFQLADDFKDFSALDLNHPDFVRCIEYNQKPPKWLFRSHQLGWCYKKHHSLIEAFFSFWRSDLGKSNIINRCVGDLNISSHSNLLHTCILSARLPKITIQLSVAKPRVATSFSH